MKQTNIKKAGSGVSELPGYKSNQLPGRTHLLNNEILMS